MLRKLLVFVFLQCWNPINSTSSPDCSYFQKLEEGESFYVYNPHYPNQYEGQNNCEWISTSDRPITVNCSVQLPTSPQCMQDVLVIQGKSGSAKRYCGSADVLLEENGEVNITLDTSNYSQGGRFLCEIKTAMDEDDSDVPDETKKCHCGWTNPEKIVAGSETGVNEYSMMAGLIDAVHEIIYCGATIINSRQVITAASCVADKAMNSILVLVGEHDWTTGRDTKVTKVFRVNMTYIHPYYSRTDNDIAGVTILGTIEFSREVGPVCLPFEHANDTFAGQFVEVLGWGLLEFAGTQATTLQKVELSVITNYECKRFYPDIQQFQMCTFTEGKDSCQLDSGGPILWRNSLTKRIVLVGIINSGTGCASDKPTLNARVGAYVDWIVSVSPSDVKYCIEE